MNAEAQRFLKLALIGHPVSHSLSPLMHRAAISFSGLQGTYDLIDCEPQSLPALAARLKQTYTGYNVTVPHKQAIMQYLDALTPEARRVQAVNTVRMESNGRAIGHNTDAGGFMQALKIATGKEKIHFPTICIVGAGGAARAALWALTDSGTQQVVIVARTLREARMMREEFIATSNAPVSFIFRSPGEPLNTNAPGLIVNCTPIGLSGDAVPDWFVSLMQNSRRGAHIPVLFDMVYTRSPESTQLVQKARSLGLVACDGLQMLIEQAALAFEFWTGVKVPTSVMASGIAQEQSSGC